MMHPFGTGDIPVDVTNPTTHPVLAEWIVHSALLGLVIGLLIGGVALWAMSLFRSWQLNVADGIVTYKRKFRFNETWRSALPAAIVGFLVAEAFVVALSIASYAGEWDRYRQIIGRSS